MRTIDKSIFELTYSDVKNVNFEGTSTLLSSAVNGSSLPNEHILFNVKNIDISIEANSIMLKWSNPPVENFNYVQVRMSHCSEADYSAHPEYLDINVSEILYTGTAEFFNYVVPVSYEGHLFNFWISAFTGTPIPSERLETWSEIG